MRTTLVIPDAVYHRAKEAARELGCTLPDFVTEAIEIRLAARADQTAAERKPYRVRQISMGNPRIDVNDRDALYRAMAK
jgi:hypothetical protein